MLTPSTTTALFNRMTAREMIPTVVATERTLKGFAGDLWFGLKLEQWGLLKYLDYCVDGLENTAKDDLIYAYTYAGTKEGVIRFAQAIFGRESIIVITTEPAVWGFDITNANQKFNYGLSAPPNEGLVGDKSGLTAFDFQLVGSDDIDVVGLFQLMIPTGHYIDSFSINGGRLR